jgi:hypothetical protein
MVQDENSKDVWFGPVNTPISYASNRFCRDMAVKYLNCRTNLYVVGNIQINKKNIKFKKKKKIKKNIY